MRASQVVIEELSFTNKFKQDYKKSTIDIRKQVDSAIEDLLKNPMPNALRFKKYNGYSNPNIFAIHVTKNHSHKISLEMQGKKAILRRIGTHKEVDSSP